MKYVVNHLTKWITESKIKHLKVTEIYQKLFQGINKVQVQSLPIQWLPLVWLPSKLIIKTVTPIHQKSYMMNSKPERNIPKWGISTIYRTWMSQQGLISCARFDKGIPYKNYFLHEGSHCIVLCNQVFEPP